MDNNHAYLSPPHVSTQIGHLHAICKLKEILQVNKILSFDYCILEHSLVNSDNYITIVNTCLFIGVVIRMIVVKEQFLILVTS